jgi:hypothetical protein
LLDHVRQFGDLDRSVIKERFALGHYFRISLSFSTQVWLFPGSPLESKDSHSANRCSFDVVPLIPLPISRARRANSDRAPFPACALGAEPLASRR